MTSSIRIRRAVESDAQALSLIACATFLETYSDKIAGADIVSHCTTEQTVEKYARFLKAERTACWLAEVEETGAPVGYAVVCPSDFDPPSTPEDLQLKRIYVLSKFHGGGAGQSLLNAAMEGTREISAPQLLLGVYSLNHRAIAFYRKSGFEQVGTREYHVGDSHYHDYVFSMPLS